MSTVERGAEVERRGPRPRRENREAEGEAATAKNFGHSHSAHNMCRSSRACAGSPYSEFLSALLSRAALAARARERRGAVRSVAARGSTCRWPRTGKNSRFFPVPHCGTDCRSAVRPLLLGPSQFDRARRALSNWPGAVQIAQRIEPGEVPKCIKTAAPHARQADVKQD